MKKYFDGVIRQLRRDIGQDALAREDDREPKENIQSLGVKEWNRRMASLKQCGVVFWIQEFPKLKCTPELRQRLRSMVKDKMPQAEEELVKEVDIHYWVRKQTKTKTKTKPNVMSSFCDFINSVGSLLPPTTSGVPEAGACIPS